MKVLTAIDRPFQVLMESKMEQNVEKHEYETPNLTVHGSIETITQGGGGSTATDASFPAHTPIGDLTFS
ncbi:lasso peptide [Mesorhizobium sp. ESP7-2]|uniref:lasso peptide n=2 Tax=unclassified Mesorhizobium TaxID=325217 RepID=UPI001CCC3B15|nr:MULTISPECIES: lasso peptide [unclassified Mesorhizobium]MBZ9710949.1 lasso peptide [Mesorhizobium sp. ESP7-2]